MANAERPHIQEVLVDSMGAAAASGHAAVEWSHFEQRCSFGSWRELDPCLEARLPLSGWHCASHCQAGTVQQGSGRRPLWGSQGSAQGWPHPQALRHMQPASYPFRPFPANAGKWDGCRVTRCGGTECPF